MVDEEGRGSKALVEESAGARVTKRARYENGGCSGSTYVKPGTERHPGDPPNATGKVEETNDKVATPTARAAWALFAGVCV